MKLTTEIIVVKDSCEVRPARRFKNHSFTAGNFPHGVEAVSFTIVAV